MRQAMKTGVFGTVALVGLVAWAGGCRTGDEAVVTPMAPAVEESEPKTPEPASEATADDTEAEGTTVLASEPLGDGSGASESKDAATWEVDPAHVLPVELAGMRFWPGKGWIREEPASEMRAAEFRLPREDWDPETRRSDAQLTVYYFGEQGAGDIEANIERWLSQFEASGDDQLVADISRHESNSLVYHIVRVEGTYVAETSPGSGEHRNEKNWAMVALIIDTTAGPYYARFLGPRATMQRHEPGIAAMIDSIEPN